MNKLLYNPFLKRLLLPVVLLVFLLFSLNTKGQEKPPRPITVTVSNLQHLNFGSIVPIGAGGSFEVYHDNSSLISGNLLQLRSYDCKAAIFIIDAEPGVLINIAYPESFQLSNSGYHMQVDLSDPYVDHRRTDQFITKGKTTYVYFGGTLNVGTIGSNPSGFYEGEFTVTFIQE